MGSHRLFLVEDEAIIAADLQLRLQKMGFSVVGIADTGAKAMAQIEATQPDLVLMDIVIKGPLNGIETTRRMRTRIDVPVVFLTSHSDTKTVHAAVGTDPHGYVLKPFNDRELELAIRIALHRHATESKLRKLERWMATTLASIGEGVLATDERGRITLINKAAQKLTGWSEAEAVGEPFDDVFRIIDAQTRKPVRGVVERGRVESFSVAAASRVLLQSRHGAEMEIDDRIAPLAGEKPEQTGVVLVFRDATEQRRMAALEREKLAAELASQQKSRFLSRVSHELRTPLNAILGFTQLLQSDPDNPLDSIQRERVGNVQTAGKHLLALINDVLDLTQLEEGGRPLRLAPVLLDPLLKRCCDMVQGLAQPRGIRVEATPTVAPYLVKADVRALEQLLINLLSNAIKYNRSGGVASVQVQATDDVVEITVSDQGSGIDEIRIADLFQPFNRLGAENSSIEGSGLGLVIAKGLAEGMGGAIGVTSRIGEGSAFSIRLQRCDPESVPSTATLEAIGVSHGVADADLPPATLVYIEDEPLNALLLTEALRGIPQWQIVLAEDGETGLEICRRILPDVVLVDINLPKLTGEEVVHALRADARTRGLCCVALSADALPDQISASIAAGFDAYWTKPLDLAVLVERLRPLVERAVRVPPVHQAARSGAPGGLR